MLPKKIKQIASAPKKVASHVYVRRGRYGVAAGIIAGSVITRHLNSEGYQEAVAFIKLKGFENEFFDMEHDWQDMV